MRLRDFCKIDQDTFANPRFFVFRSVPLDRLLDAGQAFCKKTWTHVETEFYGERGLDR